MKTACCNTSQIHVVGKEIICANLNCTNYLGNTLPAAVGRSGMKIGMAFSAFVISFLFTFEDFSKGTHNLKPINFDAGAITVVPITPKTLELEMRKQNILCVPEVVAQIRLESANMTSYLFRKTNNMLGMRYPFVRQTTACGIFIPSMDTIIIGTQQELKKYAKLEHYAAYKSWQDAVKDYKLWQDSNFKLNDRYLEFLGKVYAEDSLYVRKIKQMTAMN